VQLHQLRYVLAVAECGSFSKAAESLFLSQPSLSVQVRKLEEELGVALFERLARKVVLTGAGEAFLAHVRPALEQLDSARACAADEKHLRAGRVAVGALPSIAAGMLPACVSDFRRQHPGVDIRLLEHNQPAELERLLADGELDLALVRRPRTREDLEEQTLLREPFVALVPEGHPRARLSEVRCEDLRSERFVAMDPSSGLRSLFDALCHRAGFRPDVAVETTQLATLWGMVRSGVGVALVPRLAAGDACTVPQVSCAIPLRDEMTRTLLAVWRRGSLPRPPAAFLEHLLRHARAFSA
jgi:LysR family hydrogen peroxide-inducible transcriptional activator